MIKKNYTISDNQINQTLEVVNQAQTNCLKSEVTLPQHHRNGIPPSDPASPFSRPSVVKPAVVKSETTASAPTKKKPVLSAPSQHIVHSKDDKNHKGKH